MNAKNWMWIFVLVNEDGTWRELNKNKVTYRRKGYYKISKVSEIVMGF